MHGLKPLMSGLFGQFREAPMPVQAKKVNGYSKHDQVAVAIQKHLTTQLLIEFRLERDMPKYLDEALREEFPGELK